MQIVAAQNTKKLCLGGADTWTMELILMDMCDQFAARLGTHAAVLRKAGGTIVDILETLRGLRTQQAESVECRQAFRCVLRICSSRPGAVPRMRVLRNPPCIFAIVGKIES